MLLSALNFIQINRFYLHIMKKIVTHNGVFHADDVFAMATLQLYFGGEELEVIRTRDEEIIKTGDWVFDVGGIYDPTKRRFDHHQPGAPVRENGIPYAAFGLVWKQVGEDVAGSKEVAEKIDENLAQPIDANDNGVSLYDVNEFGVAPLELSAIIKKIMNPVWGSDEDYDKQFLQAVAMAKTVLERSIKHAKAKLEMVEFVEQVYKAAIDKMVLVFDKSVSSRLLVKHEDVLAVVFPDDPAVSSNWIVVAIPKAETGFEVRFTFPSEWGGLRNEELTKVSGIGDAIFCHKNCHLLITKSKESAVAAAEKFAK